MVRVAVARVDVLVVVRPRLRRPEWGKRGRLVLDWKLCFAGPPGRASVPGRLVVVPLPLLLLLKLLSRSGPDGVLRVRLQTNQKIIPPEITLPEPEWKYFLWKVTLCSASCRFLSRAIRSMASRSLSRSFSFSRFFLYSRFSCSIISRAISCQKQPEHQSAPSRSSHALPVVLTLNLRQKMSP